MEATEKEEEKEAKNVEIEVNLFYFYEVSLTRILFSVVHSISVETSKSGKIKVDLGFLESF